MTVALADAGVTRAQAVAFADELWVGLHGQVRRVLAPRGMEVRQLRQLTYEWVYLALAVDGQQGRLSWTWLAGMGAEEVELAVEAWLADGMDALVWDGASSHRGELIVEDPVPRVIQPPASPELNPAERLFREIRRHIEGRLYATLAEKVLKVENYLRRFAQYPAKVQRLCGWDWICDSLDSLPEKLA